MSENFKYILEPYKGAKTRHICPKCQKKGQFTKYIDKDTGQPLAHNVGLCNRAVNCGYHYTPKQYFSDNKHLNHDQRKPLPQPIAKPEPKEVKAISLIPKTLFKKSLRGYDNNHFATFLINRLGNNLAEEVSGLYFLGTSKHWKGANIFWQIDFEGRIRTGKVMLYNSDTGKRVKEPYPHINWIHKLGKYKDFNLNQCLFGEHLLNEYPNKPVAIVESEKTAMLCAGYCPDFNWLASGNLNNLSAKRVQLLKGKKVRLYPDAGAYQIWKQKADQLKDIASFEVSNLIETKATPEQLKKGYDMADYLTELPKYTGAIKREQIPVITPKNERAKQITDEVGNDSFFDEIKGTVKNEFKSWPIDELENYFCNIKLPKEPIQIDASGKITDVKKYVEVNLRAAKLHNGERTYKPYFDRLLQLRNYLEEGAT